ncbi:unnamed protein product [Camellia sinensis]
MWKEIGDREFGKLRPNLFTNCIRSTRLSSLQLSNYKDIVSPYRGSVNSLQFTWPSLGDNNTVADMHVSLVQGLQYCGLCSCGPCPLVTIPRPIFTWASPGDNNTKATYAQDMDLYGSVIKCVTRLSNDRLESFCQAAFVPPEEEVPYVLWGLKIGGGGWDKDARTMWKEIGDREFGKLRPNLFTNRIRSTRLSSLQLSNYKDIVSPHRGSVNSLQVDLTEGRYLLSGASDASVAIYDVQHATNYEGGGLLAKHKSIINIDKQHDHGHKYAISSAIWYPIDTGLFITGSYDHHINVWDTNTTQVVVNFKMPGKVYRTAMSSLATSHMLIAAGTEDVQVRLCDIASGAFAHTLSGHRDGVMTAEWSTSNEWVLITGGCDGAIRFWDIRRAGCFRVLNQSHSQLGRRPPLLERAAMNKVSSSKSSSAGQSSSVKARAPQRKMAHGNGSKQSAVSKISSQVKSSARQRLHPGMLSSQDHATAHYGAVIGLKVTEDGMYLLSAGSDSRLRLWDIESGCNTLVNFETVRLQTGKAIQLATTQDSALVFVPCMTSVKVFDMWSGKTVLSFRGHYEHVNCCWYSSQDQELYTGGNDRKILVWSPTKFVSDELDEWIKRGKASALDQDNWSD